MHKRFWLVPSTGSSRWQSNTTQETDVLGEVECVTEQVVTLACLWSAPLRVALYLCLLWGELGPGILVGVALLLVLIPVNSAVECKAKQLRRTQLIIREGSEQLIKEMLHKYQGSGEAHRLYLRAFGWHWVLVSLLLYLAVSAISLTQDGILSMLMGEAKTVQDLEEWRELRNSRLSAYALLRLLQVGLH